MRPATAIIPLCALAMFFRIGEVQAQNHEHAGKPVVIEMTMADFSFSPAILRIPAGRPVKLVFENTGAMEHEFMAGRTTVNGDFATDLFANIDVEMGSEDAANHDPADAAAHDHPEPATHVHADPAEHMHAEGQDGHGTMIGVGAGARRSMTFELPADLLGEWEMACFIPGHYDGGMHGTVIVY